MTAYSYDLHDRLTRVTYADGRKLEYEYDENGNRRVVRATLSSTILNTLYSYDDANRLDLVTDPLSRTYDHGTTAAGTGSHWHVPMEPKPIHSYDTLNRLTALTTTRPSSSLTVQSYA